MYIAVVVIIYHIKENEGDLESAQKDQGRREGERKSRMSNHSTMRNHRGWWKLK